MFLPPVSPTRVTVMFDVKSDKGVSLIELIFTILILSLALVGIAYSISVGTGRSSDTLVEIQAVALAQAYLDEIIGKRFDEGNRASGIPPCRVQRDGLGDLADGAARRCSEKVSASPPPRQFGPDGSEVRDTFDDVDDYDGLEEGFGLGPGLELKDANNVVRGSEYDNFRILIDVIYFDPMGTDVTYSDPGTVEELDDGYDAKLITITIFNGNETDGFVFSVYKSNF
ncbi:MAG: MSHA pilin protein MshD [Cyclobacteriaceae bacterium]